MRIPLGFLSAALMAASGALYAQTPDALQVRSWAAACANCHGTNGAAQAGMVSLAGAPREQLLTRLMDFKADKVPATVMHQLAKGYSDAQLAALATYFAAQPKP